MPEALLARSAAYSKRLLYGAAGLLSLAIVLASGLVLKGLVEEQQARAVPDFISYSQEFGKAADQLTAQLRQFKYIYEAMLSHRVVQGVPEWSHLNLLSPKRSVIDEVITPSNVPLRLFVPWTSKGVPASVPGLLEVAQNLANAPAIAPRADRKRLTAYLYSEGGEALAIMPTVPSAPSAPAAVEGRAAIAAIVEPIEQAFSKGGGADPSWRARPDGGAWLRTVLRSQGGTNLTIVLDIPDPLSLLYQPIESRPGYFILDATGTRVLVGDSRQASYLLAFLHAHPGVPRSIGTRLSIYNDGGNHFTLQRIGGPGWIIGRVHGWRAVLAEIEDKVLAGTLLWMGILCAIWIAVRQIERRYGAPLRSTAERLVEEQRLLRAIIETLPVGIVVADDVSKEMVLTNVLAERLLSAARLRDGSFLTTVRNIPSDMPRRGGEHKYMEVAWTRDDGRTSFIGVASSLIQMRGRVFVLIGVIDVNDRKFRESQLEEARREAQRALESRGLFLAMASHEIRTPLHGVVGYLDLLGESPLLDNQKEWLSILRHAFEGITRLVDGILDVFKAEHEAVVVNPRVTVINDIAESCARNFSAIVCRSGLSLFCATDPALDELVKADDVKVGQILQNLLANALRFTSSGRVWIETEALEDNGVIAGCVLKVSDTGLGMGAALQSSLFTPLAQGDVDRPDYRGAGLGLHICKELAEAMGGTISVSSEPGFGSCFTVQIPLGVVRAEARSRGVAITHRCRLRCPAGAIRKRWRQRLAMLGWDVVDGDQPSDDTKVEVEILDADEVRPDSDTAPGNVKVCLELLGPVVPERQGDMVRLSAFARRALGEALDLAMVDTTGAVPEKSDPSQSAHRVLRHRFSGLGRVLVAEDDPVSQALMEDLLKSMSPKLLVCAKSAEAAWNEWQSDSYDVLLTDVNLPGMSGLALAARVRESSPDALIILVTAGSAHDVDGSIVDSVLTKPVRRRDLLSALSSEEAESGGYSSSADADDDWVRNLAVVFLENWPADRERLRRSLASNERAVFGRLLHRLKGALLSMGFDDLVFHVEALEQSIAEMEFRNHVEWCEALIEEIEHALGSVVRAPPANCRS